MEYWFTDLECQIWSTNKNYFSGKAREALQLIKNFLLISEFPIIFFGSLSKAET